MKCSHLTIEGVDVILCGSKRIASCCGCGTIATKACDWKTHPGTCDAAICDDCAAPVGDDLDLCPKHAKAWEVHPGNAQAELAL